MGNGTNIRRLKNDKITDGRMKSTAYTKITVGIVILLLTTSGVLLFIGYKQQKLNDAFLDAVFKGDYQKVVELIEQGADIRAKKRQFYSRSMAIHLSAWQGHLNIVKYLFDKRLYTFVRGTTDGI